MFLTSVFTHVRAPEMNHYLSEIARVMKPGSRCLMSFILLNPDAPRSPGAVPTFDFKFKLTDCFSAHEEPPEAAIAFDEGYVRSCLAKWGFTLIEPIHPGWWRGEKAFVDGQDIVVVTR